MLFLPNNFTLDRYGLHVRFVTEDDALFIMAIRIDAKNKRFIHDTDNDPKSQIEYIRNYKFKEQLGEEYYFIFESNGIPQGVYRIYNRCEDWCTTGSWVFSPTAEKLSALKAYIIIHEIVFENLGYSLMKDYDGTNEKNVHVINTVKYFGANFNFPKRIDAKGVYLPFSISRDVFFDNRKKVLQYLLS